MKFFLFSTAMQSMTAVPTDRLDSFEVSRATSGSDSDKSGSVTFDLGKHTVRYKFADTADATAMTKAILEKLYSPVPEDHVINLDSFAREHGALDAPPEHFKDIADA